MPLSMWYRPVVRPRCCTAAGIVRVIHCDWDIPACCVIGRSHHAGMPLVCGPVSSASACDATAVLHGGRMPVCCGQFPAVSACGVTVRLHGGGDADLVPPGPCGICVRCDCCVAWMPGTSVMLPNPRGICLPCDCPVTRWWILLWCDPVSSVSACRVTGVSHSGQIAT